MKNIILGFLLLAMMAMLSCQRKSGEKAADTPAADTAALTIETITRQIMQDSSNAGLFRDRAILYLAQQNPNRALRDMNAAIALKPGNPRYMLDLADIFMSMGLIDNTMESLNKALSLDPDNMETLLKLAEINLILQQYKAAVEYSDKAIILEKSNPLPYFIKAYAFAETGDTLLAIKTYLEAVSVDQDYYDAYVQLGLIYSKAKNRLAIDYLNNALNIRPESTEALYALALAYQEQEQAENAIQTYNRLIIINPQHVYAHYNLGYAHLVFLNDYEQAITYFDKVLELDPGYYDALYNKAYCYELLGDPATAWDLYKQVLEIAVNHEKAIDGLNRLEGR